MNALRRLLLVLLNAALIAYGARLVLPEVKDPDPESPRTLAAAEPGATEEPGLALPAAPAPTDRRLFDRRPSPVDAPPAEAPETEAAIVLVGVVGGSRPVALVRTAPEEPVRRVRVGDALAGWRVAAVGPKAIDLARLGARRRITLDPPR